MVSTVTTLTTRAGCALTSERPGSCSSDLRTKAPSSYMRYRLSGTNATSACSTPPKPSAACSLKKTMMRMSSSTLATDGECDWNRQTPFHHENTKDREQSGNFEIGIHPTRKSNYPTLIAAKILILLCVLRVSVVKPYCITAPRSPPQSHHRGTSLRSVRRRHASGCVDS